MAKDGPKAVWPCKGCEVRLVAVRYTFCRRCRRIRDKGNPLDGASDLTWAEFERLRRTIPGESWPEQKESEATFAVNARARERRPPHWDYGKR